MTAHPPFALGYCLRTIGTRAATLAMVTLCSALLLHPMVADAMSLGRSRGAAIVGRALDMSILASVETQEATPDLSCFSAEVFYGDTRVNTQNVSVTPLRTGPTELTLRVRSSTPIDEPFVTLYLRAACGLNVSRKYVLLSDSPSEPAPAVPAFTPQASAPTEPRLPRVSTPSAVTESSGGLASGGVSDAASRALDRAAQREAQMLQRELERQERAGSRALGAREEIVPSPRKARVRPPKPEVAAAVEVVPKSAPTRERSPFSPTLGSAGKGTAGRLKLDLLDVSPTRDPNLRASAEMLTQPSTDPQARAQAAAMWRIISSQPQDLLRDVERLKVIETEVRAMSELTKRQAQEMGALKTELTTAKSQRFNNPLVYGLGALTLLTGGAALWAWRRRSSHPVAAAPWWGGAQTAKEPESRGAPGVRSSVQPSAGKGQMQRSQDSGFGPLKAGAVAAGAVGVAAAAAQGTGSQPGFSPSGYATLDLSGAAPSSGAGQLARRGAGVSDSGFDMGVASAPRPVNAEELFDIQQQADFFMSLGQHEQAIDVLQNHISDNLETSALAYMDLFDIYHKVGQRAEFETLRDEFNRVFNAQVPEFGEYGKQSHGLEEYPAAIERIQALWPTPKVLEVIEESIFRKPDLDDQPFDLTAYRELMLLYAIAKEVSEQESVQQADSQVDFDLTSPGGIAAAAAGASAQFGSGPASQPAAYSYTEIQPLSAAMAQPSYGASQFEPGMDDEFAAAHKRRPPASQLLGLDIDLEMFSESASGVPLAPEGPDVSLAQAKPGDGNAIDFDMDMFENPPPKKPKA